MNVALFVLSAQIRHKDKGTLKGGMFIGSQQRGQPSV